MDAERKWSETMQADISFFGPEVERKHEPRALQFVHPYPGNVIESCAPARAQIYKGHPGNLRAMLHAAKEYGRY